MLAFAAIRCLAARPRFRAPEPPCPASLLAFDAALVALVLALLLSA